MHVLNKWCAIAQNVEAAEYPWVGLAGALGGNWSEASGEKSWRWHSLPGLTLSWNNPEGKALLKCGLYAPYSPWPFAGPAEADCSLASGLFRSLLVPLDLFPPIRIYISELSLYRPGGSELASVSQRGILTQPDPETVGALPSSPKGHLFQIHPHLLCKKLLIGIGTLKMRRKIILLRNVPLLIKIWNWLSKKHFASSCIKR